MNSTNSIATHADARSIASRFTIFNGVFYAGFGSLVYVAPSVAQSLFRETESVGREASLIRAIGAVLVCIGWLYAAGGRSGGSTFVKATVVDRFMAALLLFPIALGGTLPRMFGTFVALDPALALVAWVLVRRAR